MAAAGSLIRQWLDLLEAIETPWVIARGRLFDQSLEQMATKVPDLRERLARFATVKLPNPLSREAVFGKHDTAFTLMPGFRHCHLAPDAILIYRLVGRCVQLVLICQHHDIEGKRIRALGKRLAEGYQPGDKYNGRVPEIRYLPVSAIERQEMDFRPEVMRVSDEVAANMDFSEPVEVTAYRYGAANDDTQPVVTLIDGHHRTAAALQTGRRYLPVDVKARNAKGEKLNALIAMSREIEASL